MLLFRTMPGKYKKYILGIGVLSCAAFGYAPSHAEASTIASQTVYSVLGAATTGTSTPTFTGSSATAGLVHFKLDNFANSGTLSYAIELYDVTAATAYLCDAGGSPWYQKDAGPGSEDVTVNCNYANVYPGPASTTAFQLNPTHTYRFNIIRNTSGGDYYKALGNGSYPYFVFESGTLGDGNYSTHVISIETPSLYSTTTSPVSVVFKYYASTNQVPNGYVMTFTNTLSFASKRYLGSLNGFSGDNVYTLSTSTPLTGDGTWKLDIALIDYSPDAPTVPYSLIGNTITTWFGLGFNDNVTTVSSSGCTDTVATSSSCSINFLGSFDAGQCIAYVFTPTCAVKNQFSNLTLSHSFPFSYAYQVGGIVNAVFNSPQTASSTISVTTPIGNITFLSKELMEAVPFAGLIKTLLSAVMWFMAVMVIYRRILGSHDTTTQV